MIMICNALTMLLGPSPSAPYGGTRALLAAPRPKR